MNRNRRRIVKKRKRIVVEEEEQEEEIEQQQQQQQFDYGMNVEQIPIVLKLCMNQKYDDLISYLDNSYNTINETKKPEKMNALMYCCEKGLIKFVRLLLTRGIRLNCRDKNGNTELFYGLKSGNIELMNMLITNGSCRNIKNNDKKNVFDMLQNTNTLIGRGILDFFKKKPPTIFESVLTCNNVNIKKFFDNNGMLSNMKNSSGMTLMKILEETNVGEKREVYNTVLLLLDYGSEKSV